MRMHHYTTALSGEALEAAILSLANTSFTLLLTSRVTHSTARGSEIRARGHFMRARGWFRARGSESTIELGYGYSRTLVVYPGGCAFMIYCALFADVNNFGPLGQLGERILALAVVFFTVLLLWGMATSHRRSFIRRIEDGLKLKPIALPEIAARTEPSSP